MAQSQTALPLSLGATDTSERLHSRESFLREAGTGREDGQAQFSQFLREEQQQHANNLAGRHADEKRQADSAAKQKNATAAKASADDAAQAAKAGEQDGADKSAKAVDKHAVNENTSEKSAKAEDSAAAKAVTEAAAQAAAKNTDSVTETDAGAEAGDWFELVAAMQQQLQDKPNAEAPSDDLKVMQDLIAELPEAEQQDLRQLFAEVDADELAAAFAEVIQSLQAGEKIDVEKLQQSLNLSADQFKSALAALGVMLQQQNREQVTNPQLSLAMEPAKDGAQQQAQIAAQLQELRQLIRAGDKNTTPVMTGEPVVRTFETGKGLPVQADLLTGKNAQTELSDAKTLTGQIDKHIDKATQPTMVSKPIDERVLATEKNVTNATKEENLAALKQAAEGKITERAVPEAANVKDVGADASKLVASENRSINQLQQAARDAQVQAKAAPTSFAEAMRQAQQPLDMNQQQASQQLRERMMFMMNNGIQRAEIRLDPPDLGSMTVRVTVQNEQAQVNFQVQSPQAREMLEQAMPRLRELMEQQGMQLADSEVSQQQKNDSESQAGQTAAAGSEQDEDELQWQGELSLIDGGPLVPGRVDFFA
ncbi:MAG: flagellar hook-length control protein FliK [Idiomarina sp.]